MTVIPFLKYLETKLYFMLFSNVTWKHPKDNLYLCVLFYQHEMKFIILVVKEDGMQNLRQQPIKSRRNLHDKMCKRDSYQNYCLI